MLAQDSAFRFNVPGSSTIVEVPLEGLRGLLTQVETELHRSQVYRRAVSSLEQIQTEEASGAHFLLKAVGREAIRLALKQFLHQSTELQANSPTSSPNLADRQTAELDPEAEFVIDSLHDLPALILESCRSRAETTASENTTENLTIAELVQGISLTEAAAPSETICPLTKEVSPETLLTSALTSQPVAIVASTSDPENPRLDLELTDAEIPVLNRLNRARKSLSSSELAELEAQERRISLRRLGKTIRKARERQALSLEDLHHQTFIPLHQLKALEAGEDAQLPEEVYLRGFLQRIAPVLGLDRDHLLDSLPGSDPVKAILPSWQPLPITPPTQPSRLPLKPAHLCLGSAALVAGGLLWVSHQMVMDQSSKASGSSPESSQRLAPTSQQRAQGINTPSPISPPEMIT